MATVNPAPTAHRTAKAAQRLLVDASGLTVRKLTKSEGAILSTLGSLAPVERATVTTIVEAMGAKKRKGHLASAAA